MTVYEWARRYRDHDWQVVPLAPQTKRATTREWPEIDFTPEHFAPGDNLGLRSVNGLVFVDVDCPEAVQMANAFLPATPTIYGRPMPQSHCDAARRRLLAERTADRARDSEMTSWVSWRIST